MTCPGKNFCYQA